MDILYTVSGKVYKGDQRGRELGYPTANIALSKHIPEGIYAATVTIANKVYFAATFVGSAKTFKKTKINVESYLLNFNSNIYNKQITVKLYKKIRDNEAFVSKEKLVEQMDEDILNVKAYFQLAS